MGTRMRDGIIRNAATLLMLAVAAQAAPPDTAAAGPKAGNITALLPTANILRGPAKQPVTSVAKKGDDVVWNDLVRTDKGGRARITLLDQSVLSVGSQAELRIIKSDAKSQQTSIEVGYGRVRAEVAPITKQGGSFEVKTPTAVAGVIGTTFGIESAVGATTFLCVSGTTMVGSNNPSVPGRVACTAGMAAVVSAGKAPTTRPATPQELQQMVQDTEPAVVSAMNPSSLSPGSVADATISGTQLGNINAVTSSSTSVTATLNAGGSATAVSVHLVVAANAAPGPVTLTLGRPTGVNSAAVFNVVPSQAITAGGGAPAIQGLSTTTAPASGGVAVTITGANFDANTRVMFGNIASTNVTFVSPTQLTVVTPPGSPGTVDLTIVNGGGMTTTLSNGFSFGGPVAAITPQDVTVNPGASLTLDGSRSSDTLAGTTLTYSWTLCSLGFKPPQTGASLPATSAPVCNPAPGTVAGSDSLFAVASPATPGQYSVRLQVTDNLGAAAVFYSSVTVSQPIYDDPVTRMNSLVQSFSTLQSATVLGFFDPSYTGLTSLQQSLQTVFPTYSSMTVNLLSVTPNITGTTAQVQANWQLKYTIKNDPACKGVSNCQPPTYSPSPETRTTVWTLNPSKGWFVTEFRLPNGFTQGTLPAVPVTTVSQPDLVLVGVDSPVTPGSPIPVGTGQQSFRATVKNMGTADFTQTTMVTFTLSVPSFSQIASVGVPIGPIAVGQTAQATVTVTVPDNIAAVTAAQITASVNTGCPIPESACTNNAGTFPVVITPANVALPNLVTKITNVTSGATLGTGSQTIQATVTNSGNAVFTSSPPVNFAVVVAGSTVASTQVAITGPIAVNQAAPVQATLNIPTTIAAGTAATLSVDASPTCPNPVEPDCTDNTASLPIIIGVPPNIIVTSSRGNNTAANPVELNGILNEAMTLTATRSDGVATGSVTLTLADSTGVGDNPAQFSSIPYNAPQPAEFFATLDGSGNVTTGLATVTVTPSNAVPPAGPQTTTLFYNVGDINLSLPSGTICVQIGPGSQAPVPGFSINAISGFNLPSVSWQWAGLTGVTVNQVSGVANLSGGVYALPAFSFTVSTPGTPTFLFAVTVTNAQGSATKTFVLNFNLSASPCGGVGGHLGGAGVSGTWSRGGLGGGIARLTPPTQTGALPDLQINAASVSFSPSIPMPGDTVSVRFRVSNAGNADARQVPIALVVGGVTVASETLDLRAGASTITALEWTNAQRASGNGPLQAAVMVDPNRTIVQKSALAKSAPLVHFSLQPGPGAPVGTPAGGAQHATLELADGGCVGFRFASGAGSACGSADVEITVEQMSSGRFTLAAQIGIADLGPAFGGGKLANVQYQSEVAAVAGHSYAVQLRGGRTGIFRLMAIRNSGQTSSKSRQVFGAGKVASSVGTGQTSGPTETGDVSGVHTQSQSKAYFDVSYQTQ